MNDQTSNSQKRPENAGCRSVRQVRPVTSEAARLTTGATMNGSEFETLQSVAGLAAMFLLAGAIGWVWEVYERSKRK